MKVVSCNTSPTTTKEPKLLSFDEIKKKEGVYKPYPENRQVADSRLIVVLEEFCQTAAVLFFNSHDGKLENAQDVWDGYKFVEMQNVQVCFEIRSKDNG